MEGGKVRRRETVRAIHHTVNPKLTLFSGVKVCELATTQP